MNAALVVETIENGGCVFNIGQIEPDAQRELNRRVRQGKITKIKSRWPWHQCGITKTAYCLPALAYHFSQETS